LEWVKDADDVPRPCQGFHWSVSHKPKFAAGVVAKNPVGIDVEYITPRSLHLYEAVAEEAEWDLLGGRAVLSQADDWSNFFRLWTAKEATLKANGVGIGSLGYCRLAEVRDDDHVAMSFRGSVWLVEHRSWGDHVAAVTASGDGIVWHLPSTTNEFCGAGH